MSDTDYEFVKKMGELDLFVDQMKLLAERDKSRDLRVKAEARKAALLEAAKLCFDLTEGHRSGEGLREAEAELLLRAKAAAQDPAGKEGR